MKVNGFYACRFQAGGIKIWPLHEIIKSDIHVELWINSNLYNCSSEKIDHHDHVLFSRHIIGEIGISSLKDIIDFSMDWIYSIADIDIYHSVIVIHHS